MSNTIPKVIHYCWFGGNDLPELAIKCIDSWKKYFPDYEIKEWNESNFDVSICHYSQEAYEEKKWAFVSDYARFWILYHYGGLYFDTDVEVIRDFSDIIANGPFMGCEKNMLPYKYSLQHTKDGEINSKNGLKVAPGLGLAATPGLNLYREILEYYSYQHFINTETVVTKTTNILKEHGFNPFQNGIQHIESIWIYPSEYFCPKDYFSGRLNITSNTRSIHHYTASWYSNRERKDLEVMQKCNTKFGSEFGYKIWRCYTLPIRVHNKIHQLGIFGTLKYIYSKLKRKLL
jgi:hypothetical protein